MKRLICIALLSSSLWAQVTKEDIKEILILQGKSEVESIIESKELFKAYQDRHAYKLQDLAFGTLLSSLSGFALGMYESNAFGYKNTSWMGGSLENWYYDSYNNKSDGVFAKSLTWQKVFRNIDYLTTISGYNTLERFFGGKWYFAYAVYWISKNVVSTIIRDKMKYDNWFYSYDINLAIKL